LTAQSQAPPVAKGRQPHPQPRSKAWRTWHFLTPAPGADLLYPFMVMGFGFAVALVLLHYDHAASAVYSFTALVSGIRWIRSLGEPRRGSLARFFWPPCKPSLSAARSREPEPGTDAELRQPF
jgi:hypothetical protein